MIKHDLYISRDNVLNEFVISFQSQFGSLHICFVKFLLVFDHWWMLEYFFIIYILFGVNHLSMVIARLIKIICWQFPEIALWQLHYVHLYYINIIKPRTYA